MLQHSWGWHSIASKSKGEMPACRMASAMACSVGASPPSCSKEKWSEVSSTGGFKWTYMILYNLLVFFCFIYSTYSSYSTYFTNYCVCLDLRHLLLSGSARRVQPSGAAVVGHAPTHHGASSVLLGMNIAVFDQSLFTLHQLFLDRILRSIKSIAINIPFERLCRRLSLAKVPMQGSSITERSPDFIFSA